MVVKLAHQSQARTLKIIARYLRDGIKFCIGVTDLVAWNNTLNIHKNNSK